MPLHDWTHVDAGVFHAFHLSWLHCLMQSLNGGLLPDDYYALAEQVRGRFIPDMLTLQERESDDVEEHPFGGLAFLVPVARATATLDPGRATLPRRQLTIPHVSGDRVVAVIEIVSPSNKGSELECAALTEKVLALLDQGIHVVILDAFPPTPRDPHGLHNRFAEACQAQELPLPSPEHRLMASYRAGRPATAYLYPVALAEALPDAPLFLRGPAHVLLPLESTYQQAWLGVPRVVRNRLMA
jgi:hypothetical protein